MDEPLRAGDETLEASSGLFSSRVHVHYDTGGRTAAEVWEAERSLNFALVTYCKINHT